MKTFLPKVNEIERKWWIIDADKQVLGRLAVRIAMILRGKNKPTFTPHLDCGDYVIVTNASKVVMTGRKSTDKEYQDFSGWVGGLKRTPADVMREKHPEEIIKRAVWGMMPHGRLGRAQFAKLKVFGGAMPEHNFAAQNAQPLELK
ncbi:MAG: 50S ribosomal protein L13 [Victivallales bacterium]|nr:50S ribosomal protein L13 [Victivallales bacterium]